MRDVRIIKGESASGDNHVTCGSSTEFQGPLGDSGATTIGVHPSEGKNATARFDKGCASTLDVRIDRHSRGTGGVGVVIDDKLARAAGQDTTAGDGADRTSEVFVATKQAAEFKVQHIGAGRERNVVGEGTRQTKDAGIGCASR